MMRFASLLGFALLMSAPALAQINVPGPIQRPDGTSTARRSRPQTEQVPVGVPGARADTSLTGPAQRGAADMPPTDALFDSINRGDLVGAKEALGRGADINGRNVLGLSPLELAVDLGRNDISFLLLSLRSNDGYSATRPPAAIAERAPPVARRGAPERRAQTVATRAAPAQPRAARLFAGDGGAPVPHAGFLGFDVTR